MRSISLLPKDSGPPRSLKRSRSGDQAPVAYAAGLVCVAIAIVLMPVSYCALVSVLVLALKIHLVRHLDWLFGRDANLISGCLYVLLALPLALFSVFLLRPVFRGRRSAKPDLVLARESEPRLYAFVEEICSALGSAPPVRIHVNMDVNASARFAPGLGNFFAGRLELILGLPLVRGLDLGQFAGVLAHELGHFRQSAAMRLVHGIRSVNQWFSRAASREDAWERELAGSSHRIDPFMYVIGMIARGCSMVARQTLRMHVRAGQAISCMLLRQMEHQADRAAIRLVGGEIFAGMVLEAKVLEAAWGLANRSLGMALREGRLADDLPALVSAHTRVFIPEVRRKMEQSLLQERTAWFDTHPSLAERVRRARRTAARGVFHSTGPTHALFSDFTALAREATVAFYSQDLGDDFNPSRMMSTSDLVTGESEVQVGEAAVAGYFLGQLTNLRPLWISPGNLEVTSTHEELLARLKGARDRIEAGLPRAADLYKAYAAADARILDSVQALALMRADFWIEPADFQLRKPGAAQAAQAFRSAEAEQHDLGEALAGFEEAMRLRLSAALALLSDAQVATKLSDASICFREVTRLLPVLAGLAMVHPRLESLRKSFYGLGILLENLAGNHSEKQANAQLKTHALAIRLDLEALDTGLSTIEYPFGRLPAGSTLSDYAFDAFPLECDIEAHHSAAEEALGRCYALYFRILGRLALAAGRVEGVLGLGPLKIEH